MDNKSKFKSLKIFKNNMLESQINGIHLFSICCKMQIWKIHSMAYLSTDHAEKVFKSKEIEKFWFFSYLKGKVSGDYIVPSNLRSYFLMSSKRKKARGGTPGANHTCIFQIFTFCYS